LENPTQKVTHIAFSDESHWNIGRYRSICLITLPISSQKKIEDAIEEISNKNKISELKWSGLKSSKERKAANELLELLVDLSKQGLIRADVIVWDTHDPRHDLPGRDDVKNLERMYYHLLSNALRKRWLNGCNWVLCPDEHSSLNWKKLNDCITAKGMGSLKMRKEPITNRIYLTLTEQFDVDRLEPVDSSCNSIIQLSDLLAGIVVYSRENYEKYRQWCEENNDQMSLFPVEKNIIFHPRIKRDVR